MYSYLTKLEKRKIYNVVIFSEETGVIKKGEAKRNELQNWISLALDADKGIWVYPRG